MGTGQHMRTDPELFCIIHVTLTYIYLCHMCNITLVLKNKNQESDIGVNTERLKKQSSQSVDLTSTEFSDQRDDPVPTDPPMSAVSTKLQTEFSLYKTSK